MATSPSVNTLPNDDVVMRHLPLVRRIAGSVFGMRVDDGVPFEEYVQFGLEGLLQSMLRYDPARGAQFETYASHRIRGAILSGLEKSSEINQQVATRRRLTQERLSSLIELPAAEPSQEVPESPRGLAHLIDVAIGLAVAFMLEDTGLYQNEQGSHWDDGPANLAYKQLHDRLHKALVELDESEQRVIELHYFRHIPFETIASELKLSKGRISQIHRKALLKLRQTLSQSGLGEFTG